MSSTPICRCRVLYMGSAVPHITKDGLHGIQEPLRELYPEEGVLGAHGIDSWLSVWSNGLLLENVDEKQKRVTRFFPIESLHYCAAVRHVTIPGPEGERLERFLPLDSPFARIPTPHNPPLFACILRRTAGIKVLECHAFVAKKEMAANALVRCCFHAYADNMYARKLEDGAGSIYGGSGIMAQTGAMLDGGIAGEAGKALVSAVIHGNGLGNGVPPPVTANGGSSAGPLINPIQKVEQWRAYVQHTSKGGSRLNGNDGDSEDGELVSIYDGDENHKVWAGGPPNGAPSANANQSMNDQHSIYADFSSCTIRSVKSMTGNGTQRSNRQRQIAAPASPPPPPPLPPPSSENGHKSTANGNNVNSRMRPRKNPASNSNGVGPHHYPGHPPAGNNAYRRLPPPQHPGHEFMPPWQQPPPPRQTGNATGQQPHPQIVPYGFPPPPPNMMAPLPPPPHLMGAFRAYPPHMLPPPPPPGHPGKSKKNGNSMEEPIYLPSARPMSPVASYQPGAFPYEQYYLNQSAGHALPPNPHYAQPQHSRPGPPDTSPQSMAIGSSHTAPKPSKYKKKPEKNGSSGESAGGGSKFNTGIYRKKGHLNERAFSYSIRQEHRSRSHSSLATLNFNGPNETGNGIESGGRDDDEGQSTLTTNGHHQNGHHHHQHYASNGHEAALQQHNARNAKLQPVSNGHNHPIQNGGKSAPKNGKGHGAAEPIAQLNGKSPKSRSSGPPAKGSTSSPVKTNGTTRPSDDKMERKPEHKPSMSRQKILAATNNR